MTAGVGAAEPEAPARPPIRVRLAGVAPCVVAVVATAYYFRATWWHGRLPGDLGDARWTVALTEHWFEVFTDGAAVRDVGYYFPLRETLGLSDPFLAQGVLATVARLLGAGPVQAWFTAHVLTFLAGALGVSVLARRLLVDPVQRCALVVLAVLSYALVVQSTHVQVFGFLSVSWVAVSFHGVLHGPTARARWWSALGLLFLPPLLALSSWYAFALGALVLAVLAGVAALLAPRGAVLRLAARFLGSLVGTLRSTGGVVAVVLSIASWGFAAWIYLPSFGALAPVGWREVAYLSPGWTDVLNANLHGGGLWHGPYQELFPGPPTGEVELGFTPIVAVCLLVSGLLALRRVVSRPRADPAWRGHRRALVAFVAIVVVVAVVIVDQRGNGLYRVLFELLPPFRAVRAPFRVQILLSPLACFVVLAVVGASAGGTFGRVVRPQVAVRGVTVVLTVLFLVDMHRPVPFGWRAAELLPTELDHVVDEVADTGCGALVLHHEEGDRVETLVDATVLAVLSGVPTVQGYGRGFPEGHPGWYSPTGALVAHAHDHGVPGPVCVVDDGAVRAVRG